MRSGIYEQHAPFLTPLVNRGRMGAGGDIQPASCTSRWKTGRCLWETRPYIAQVSRWTYSAGGKQYIAVMTGRCGGSPPQRPRPSRPISGSRRAARRFVRLRLALISVE